MNDRLKATRKALGLNQTEFGARIGVTNPAISKLEKGQNNLTDQMILAVCREYNVNEEWLRTGNGEMFTYSDESAVERLATEMGLDEFAMRALVAYQGLSPASRAVIKQYIFSVAASYGVSISEELEIEAQAELYKEELRQEKSTQTSSASPVQKNA